MFFYYYLVLYIKIIFLNIYLFLDEEIFLNEELAFSLKFIIKVTTSESNLVYLIILLLIFSTAFLTLFERKFMSSFQHRFGPSRVG